MSEIVVSGIGIVSPLGVGRELTWRRLIEGESAILRSSAGLEARVFDFSPNGARSRMGDFALLATAEALAHAGLSDAHERPYACAIGQSKPLLSSATSDRLDPTLLISSFSGWSAEAVVKKEFNLTGPTSNVVAACATGVAAIEWGAQWIRSGQGDIALVGAAESSLHPLYRAGFQSMGVLALRNPSDVCPFDARRSGFAMGEGAAVLVLESRASAQRRGHAPIVSLKNVRTMQGYSAAARLGPEAASIARLISRVCADRRPDYVNAHGTGTVMNDSVECAGLTLSFGAQLSEIAVSSTKAATGHLLGAAGALEAALAALSVRDDVAPPTVHWEAPADDCAIDCVPNHARYQKISSALSLSYGFGGQMGGVLWEKFA